MRPNLVDALREQYLARLSSNSTATAQGQRIVAEQRQLRQESVDLTADLSAHDRTRWQQRLHDGLAEGEAAATALIGMVREVSGGDLSDPQAMAHAIQVLAPIMGRLLALEARVTAIEESFGVTQGPGSL